MVSQPVWKYVLTVWRVVFWWWKPNHWSRPRHTASATSYPTFSAQSQHQWVWNVGWSHTSREDQHLAKRLQRIENGATWKMDSGVLLDHQSWEQRMSAPSLAPLRPMLPAMSDTCLHKNACPCTVRSTSRSWQQDQLLRQWSSPGSISICAAKQETITDSLLPLNMTNTYWQKKK